MKKPLIVIGGPTACGKTGFSIKLAKEIGGEIISADSMQVYRYMDIGTAKVTAEEADGVPHYLIDEFDPDEEYHVMLFQQIVQHLPTLLLFQRVYARKQSLDYINF